jgi:hypothetical protein
VDLSQNKTRLITRLYLCGLLVYYYVYLILNSSQYFHYKSIWGSTVDLSLNQYGNIVAGLLYSSYTILPFFVFLIILTLKHLFFGLRNFEKFIFVISNISIVGFLTNLNVRSAADVYLFYFAAWFICVDSETQNTRLQKVLNFGIRFQIASVYFFTALLKTGDAWTKDFSAIEQVFKSSYTLEWVVNLASQITNPILFKITTIGTLAFEFLIGFFILFSKSRKLDVLMAGLILGFHFLLGVFMPALTHFMFVFAINSVFLGSHVFSDLWIIKIEKAIQAISSKILKILSYFRAEYFVIAVMGLLLVSNVLEVRKIKTPLEDIFKHYGLYQTWSMFAPDAPDTNQWVEVVGIKAGSAIGKYSGSE